MWTFWKLDCGHFHFQKVWLRTFFNFFQVWPFSTVFKMYFCWYILLDIYIEIMPLWIQTVGGLEMDGNRTEEQQDDIPRVGMTFTTFQEAEAFIRRYFNDLFLPVFYYIIYGYSQRMIILPVCRLSTLDYKNVNNTCFVDTICVSDRTPNIKSYVPLMTAHMLICISIFSYFCWCSTHALVL